MNKLRWGKFYWCDWADDPALALCSLAAQGLWMRLLCIAAQGTPYGHVTINGLPPSIDDLTKLIRPRPKRYTVERLIIELERYGVVHRDADGKLISRRMEADGKLVALRTSAANARWRKKNGLDLHMQNDGFASTESEAESEVHPPTPPRGTRGGGGNGGGGGKKASRNANVDLLAENLADAETTHAHAHRRGAPVVPFPGRALSG